MRAASGPHCPGRIGASHVPSRPLRRCSEAERFFIRARLIAVSAPAKPADTARQNLPASGKFCRATQAPAAEQFAAPDRHELPLSVGNSRAHVVQGSEKFSHFSGLYARPKLAHGLLTYWPNMTAAR